MENQMLKIFCMVNVFVCLNSLFKEHKSEACSLYKMDPIGGEIPWRRLEPTYLIKHEEKHTRQGKQNLGELP